MVGVPQLGALVGDQGPAEFRIPAEFRLPTVARAERTIVQAGNVQKSQRDLGKPKTQPERDNNEKNGTELGRY